MWKPGQLVTLHDKLYRITKCSESQKYRVCHFCAGNGNAPCIEAYNYPKSKGFNGMSCAANVPEGCYPKLVK